MNPRMNFKGEESRRVRIQGRGARKAKAPMCVSGEIKVMPQIHPDPRRWEVQYTYKKDMAHKA
jgi:hypothetical protein